MGRNDVENRNFINFFQAFNDVVENSLSCQLQNAEKSVQEAKKEVLELEQVLDCAVTDLASDDPNGISIKEVVLIEKAFENIDFFHTDTIWIIC